MPKKFQCRVDILRKFLIFDDFYFFAAHIRVITKLVRVCSIIPLVPS